MKNILSVLGVLVVAATPVFSQEGSTLTERNVYLYKDGALIRHQVDEATHAMAMRMFKPMKAGSMVYFDKGTIYTAEDQSTSSGKMLSAHMLGQ